MNTPTVERDEPTDVEARLRALLSAQADEVIAGATAVLWPETIPTHAAERPRRRLALVALVAVSAAALFAAVLVTVRDDSDQIVPATTTPVVTDPAPDGPIGPGEVRMVDNAYLELVADELPPGFAAVDEPLDSEWTDAAVSAVRPLVCMEWRPIGRGAECSAVGGDVLRWYVDNQRGLGIVVWVSHSDEFSFDPSREPQDGPVVRGYTTTRAPLRTPALSGDVRSTELPTLRWKERNDQLVSITLVGNADALAAINGADAPAMLDTVALGARVVHQPRERPAMLVARYPRGSAAEGQPWLAVDGPSETPCFKEVAIPERPSIPCIVLSHVFEEVATWARFRVVDGTVPPIVGFVEPAVTRVVLVGADGSRAESATVAVPGFRDRFFLIEVSVGMDAEELVGLDTNGSQAFSEFLWPFGSGIATGVTGGQKWRIAWSYPLVDLYERTCLLFGFVPDSPTHFMCWRQEVPRLEASIVGDYVVGIVADAGIDGVTVDGVEARLWTPIPLVCQPEVAGGLVDVGLCPGTESDAAVVRFFVAPSAQGEVEVVGLHGNEPILTRTAEAIGASSA